MLVSKNKNTYMPTQNFFEIKLNDEAGEFGNQIDKEFIAGTFWWVE